MSEETSNARDIKIPILLVDDSVVFLKSFTRFLEAYNQQHGNVFELGRASSGQEAVRLAQEMQPHVILLDQNMPGLSGLDTIPLLREVLPQARIIMLTLQNSEMLRQKALQAGANDFVAKVDLAAELIPTIWRHVPHTPPPSPE